MAVARKGIFNPNKRCLEWIRLIARMIELCLEWNGQKIWQETLPKSLNHVVTTSRRVLGVHTRRILWVICSMAVDLRDEAFDRKSGVFGTILSIIDSVNFILSPATMTTFDHPNIPDATTGTQAMSFCNKQSDDVFHLSPFAQLHENTICPIHQEKLLVP